MCNLRAWPQQLMLEEVCKRIQHCCATLRRSHTQKKKCWELLAQKFVGQQVCVRLNAEQGIAQRWERSPPTSVAWVQIPVSTPYLGRVCGWFSPLLREVFLQVLRFSPSPQKSTSPNSNSTRNQADEDWTTMWMCYLQIVIYLFIYFSNAETSPK